MPGSREAPKTEERATPEPAETESSEPEEEEPAATPEPANRAPQRIRFARGKSEGTVRVGLGAGESQRFVIGVTGGQNLFIEVADFRPTIKMISTSKVTEVSEDESENTYYALTRSGGDIIFEIENGTRNSIATTVTVSITDKMY